MSTGPAAAERLVAQPGPMAAHDKLQVEEEEYEYVAITSPNTARTADESYSYEGLPPNFSLAANMAAGAFAGIAVRRFA